MLFTWHEDKAVSNRRKHGVAFADAAQVFNDPFAVAGHGRIESGERRWQIVGLDCCCRRLRIGGIGGTRNHSTYFGAGSNAKGKNPL